jgi:hypothetical protein
MSNNSNSIATPSLVEALTSELEPIKALELQVVMSMEDSMSMLASITTLHPNLMNSTNNNSSNMTCSTCSVEDPHSVSTLILQLVLTKKLSLRN